MKQFPDHRFEPNSTVYRDGVAGKVVRRLYLIDISKGYKPMQPAYEVRFADGRRLVLEENELSFD